MAGKTASGGGGKKKGRMKIWCAAYTASHTREKNKKRRLLKHLKRFPDDLVAQGAVKNIIW